MLCESDFTALVADHQYAIHCTFAENWPSIASRGIQPAELSGNVFHRGQYAARLEHTYWGLPSYQSLWIHYGFETNPAQGFISPMHVVFKVPLSFFDPLLINPDEDAFCHSDQYRTQADIYPNFGQWAQDIKLGSDPNMTLQGINKMHTFAYHGSVPASALQPMQAVFNRKWKLEPISDKLLSPTNVEHTQSSTLRHR